MIYLLGCVLFSWEVKLEIALFSVFLLLASSSSLCSRFDVAVCRFDEVEGDLLGVGEDWHLCGEQRAVDYPLLWDRSWKRHSLVCHDNELQQREYAGNELPSLNKAKHRR